MARVVVSLVRSAAGAPRGTEPALEANAYAVAEDLDVRVVLAGDAVELALAGGQAGPTEIAGVALPPAATGQDLRALIESGVAVRALSEDLRARGIDPGALVDGVAALEQTELAALLRAADAVLVW